MSAKAVSARLSCAGLLMRRRMEVEKGNVRCIRESTINCPGSGKHDYDPAA